MTAAMQTYERHTNNLQHVDLDGYRVVTVKSSKESFILAGDHATVAPHDTVQAWNNRMDALGAERGSWDQLEALLPTV